ncbi:MAG TPA: hypothetical protein VF342_04000 [Alphaproteobacteria bacterium]
MKSIPLTALAVFALAACSAPSTRWVKAGATPEDFRLDQQECVSQVQDFDFAFEDDRESGDPDPFTRGANASEQRAGSTRGDIYRRCMEARGWRREREPKMPSQ